MSSPSPPAFNLSSIRIFSNESVLPIMWPKFWSFSFSIRPSNEDLGLISLRICKMGSPCSPRDSQGSSPTPQSKSISSSVLSFLYSPTVTFIHDYWKNRSFDYKDLCWQSDASVHFLKKRKLVFSNLTKFYRLPSKL